MELVSQKRGYEILVFLLKRVKRAYEYIQILKKIWTEDAVEFKGEYYNIPVSKIGPEPKQKPHIPIYL